MTGCWSGKVAGHCLNILIFMSFIIRFNITYIMRTNGKDGRIWRESLTLAVNWLLSTVIQNHPFLQTNQNQMSVSSK
ncbi:TPA: hypothetical protein MH574_14415 [Klebsiella pneumoniae]|nr:hypothetical protein [Klebsiella pneumoniae]